MKLIHKTIVICYCCLKMYNEFETRTDKRQMSKLQFCEAKRTRVPYPSKSTNQRRIASSFVRMIVECSLPISLVEQTSFRQPIEMLDPRFNHMSR